MAKAKAPLHSLGARGGLGDVLSFARRMKLNIVEKKPVPYDAKSPAQLTWRHMFNKVVALWHGLSAAEKQAWESLARPLHMTGYDYFISQSLRPNPGIYLPLQGGTMAGDIDMAKFRILKLPAPVDGQEPARKTDLPATPTFLILTDTPSSYAGQALKGVRVNAATNALEFATLVGGYTEGARVYHNATQSIPTATRTALAFNSERYDTDAIHDPVTNNSRLTCKTAGKYILSGSISFSAHATGLRNLRIRLNGSTVLVDLLLGMTFDNQWSGAVSTIYDLAVNDYVELTVYQNSGGNLIIYASPNSTPEFMMSRVG